ncbi:MAG: hypothetical protein ACRD1V_10470 [Vicinamibacterales bacterium]
MAEVFVEFDEPIIAADGRSYRAHACGSEMPDGMWQGWIEFSPIAGGEPVRTGRETTQPNQQDAFYWATGLTPVYLEGALSRAVTPLVRSAAPARQTPFFGGPAPAVTALAPVESVLNPFSVYRKGEGLLRRQLSALSAWHLVNIIRDHHLSNADAATLEGLHASRLVELIVEAVRRAAAPQAEPAAGHAARAAR